QVLALPALVARQVEPDEVLLARLALERGRGRIRKLLAVDRDHRALRARDHLDGRLAAARLAGAAAVDRDEDAGDGRGEHRRAGGDPDRAYLRAPADLELVGDLVELEGCLELAGGKRLPRPGRRRAGE